MTTTSPDLTQSQWERVVAAFADVDRRTLQRYLRGDTVREAARDRIVAAIAKHPKPERARSAT